MHFTDLRIYQLSIQLAKEIKSLIDSIAHHWNIPESKQILRSSVSVPATIAEGFAKRGSQKEFGRFLNIALGSSDETQHHLIALFLKGHIIEKDYNNFVKGYKDLSIKILNTIRTVAKSA